MTQPATVPREDGRPARAWLRQPPAWVTALALSVAVWSAAIYLTDTPVSPIVVAGGAPFVALAVVVLTAVDRVRHRALSALLGMPCVAALTLAALYLVPAMPYIHP